ncbi:hypothetical protein Q4574_20915 [Aliiglaciecola sp. 3_MG-2023]|uniref:hypothetical protein n=1 Tax=Aliiglaciecola sp. 3_MG-2023 TaxID=3062644 RepID=UPI0026E43744|nr:hypothetical protein [Aliiglaciecola sp. 3_MG-2023]MDO6695772.1 hypothetical protein [Aliiglaciecola sp. 3_MG-2023]
MTEPTSKTLSKYQTAMLTHMGIVPWQLRSASQDATKLERQEATADAISQSASQLPSQAQKQAGLERLRQKIESNSKTLNHAVLLCMPESSSSQFLTDVLLFADLTMTDCVFIETADPKDYVDFKLAWRIGEKISINGQVLTAPTPDKIISSRDKKQLWQMLHQLF